MLDLADTISRYDKHDILGVIAGQPQQLRQEYKYDGIAELAGANSIVLAGMGGSALAGEFIKHWLSDRLPVPFEIVRGYELPAYVGKDTLVVVSSYSGNTEETISCLHDAQKRAAKVVVMSAGGALIEAATAQHLPALDVPGGLQPRLAVLYGVKALAGLLEELGLARGLVKELEAVATWSEGEIKGWGAAVPTAENSAKQLAEAFLGHPIVVYAGPTLALPAMKWKIDANENAKNLAFYYNWPEFNHNEFLGWAHPARAGLRVVELQSSLDHPQIAKRFEVSNRLLSGTMPEPIIITAVGETRLEQMVWTILLGDYAMAYLAFLNQVDPTPVPMIEKLKGELI